MMFYHDGVYFRPVERADLETLRRLRNDPSTWANLTTVVPLTEAMQERWFDSLCGTTDKYYFVAIEQSREFPASMDGDFLGLIRMDEVDRGNRSVRVGVDIMPEKRGRGWGTKVYRTLLAYCFEQWCMHRVWLCVLDSNAVGRKLYENSGFKEEGRMRHAIWRDGRWRDYVVMAILEDEYRVRHARSMD